MALRSNGGILRDDTVGRLSRTASAFKHASSPPRRIDPLKL
jgi:hypothetical protein